MSDPMPPALSEAVGALRVLGDPASAWGTNKAEGMRGFARAARERVVQLHEGQPELHPSVKPGGSLSPEAITRKLAKGLRITVTPGMCVTCGEEPAGHSGRCSRCDRNILEDRERAA